MKKKRLIRDYLQRHPEIKRYVILDDCFHNRYENDRDLLEHLVFVDAQKGLQDMDCFRACEVMNAHIQTVFL